ncbi:hypothetical protein [Chitinophaga sp. S165]|uniref:hypothetical protein n=1 Tax=Chitinophaga sp. S165 TaxID=2135462 RepID=UPI000D71B831|nr:hypothetical protein [Chitinophaga sp. S165]PWV47142.1 hypothetical protein C7475_109230 [Chitinophaga sp. S165]
MEKQEIYVLYMEGINPTNQYHHRFIIFQAYNSFRQAFLRLQHFNDRYFDYNTARKFKLPLQITFAGIRTAGDAHYLLEKKMQPAGNSLQVPPGLYVILPHPNLGTDLFDVYTENALIDCARFGNNILVASLEQLQKTVKRPSVVNETVWLRNVAHKQ